MTQRAELRGLTGARGIAAWFVVFYHIRLSIAGLPDAWVTVFAKGYLAVDFFFLLSGFVIWLSWHERLRAQGLAAVPDFLRKRIARIWPLHIAILACAVLLAIMLAATGRATPGDFPFGELPLHIALIQNWGFTAALTWNDPAWSISAELGAYLLFPLLVIAIDWRRMPSGAIVAAIIAAFLLLHIVMAYQGATTLGYDITRFGLLRCLCEFASGTALCALWLRWQGRTGIAAIALTLAAIGFGLWIAGLLPETVVIPASFAALLIGIALADSAHWNPLANRALHYLGEISYATYLGHFLLFFVFKLLFVVDPGAVPPGLIALYLGLVLASSIILYHGVEKPAQRWINHRDRTSRSVMRARSNSAPR